MALLFVATMLAAAAAFVLTWALCRISAEAAAWTYRDEGGDTNA